MNGQIEDNSIKTEHAGPIDKHEVIEEPEENLNAEPIEIKPEEP